MPSVLRADIILPRGCGLQTNTAVRLPEELRQALTGALALHHSGRAAMEKREWEQARELLERSEAAFDAIDVAELGNIDNCALMLIDLVWCALMLKVRASFTSS
jgi:hypothetical protein